MTNTYKAAFIHLRLAMLANKYANRKMIENLHKKSKYETVGSKVAKRPCRFLIVSTDHNKIVVIKSGKLLTIGERILLRQPIPFFREKLIFAIEIKITDYLYLPKSQK